MTNARYLHLDVSSPFLRTARLTVEKRGCGSVTCCSTHARKILARSFPGTGESAAENGGSQSRGATPALSS